MAFHSFDSACSAPSDQGRLMSDINVTPLVDVMLVLLVIFIITAPLLTSAIRLDLLRAVLKTTKDSILTLYVRRVYSELSKLVL